MGQALHYEMEELTNTQIRRLLDRAKAGEESVLDDLGRPVAKIVPIQSRPRRQFGLLSGKIVLADDWDSESVNQEIAHDFGAS